MRARWFPALALLASCTLATFARADDPRPAAENAAAEVKAAVPHMPIRVTDATGAPLVGSQLEFRGRVAGAKLVHMLQTDDDGKAALPIDRNAKIESLWMTCRHAGFVPVHYHWRSDAAQVQLPKVLELKLTPGAPLVGLVVDEAGAPVEGASVEIHMPITSPKTSGWVFDAFEGKTDAQGRWFWDGAPLDLADLGTSIKHPDFLRTFGDEPSKTTREIRAVLKRGLSLSGRVVDSDGKPIRLAMVNLGHDRFGSDEPSATTDAEGRFTLKKCNPGATQITVQADGFAPTFRDVTIAEKNEPLEMKLGPGHTIRFRIVDSAGQPLAATLAADTWRGHRALELRLTADAEGRAVWNGAPDDPILYDFFKQGYMSVRNVSLVAGEKEHVITMPDELIISGKVTDAADGLPIPKFEIRRGYRWQNRDELYWPPDEGSKFSAGVYEYKFDEPSDGHLLEFIAEGYKPARSREFKSNEQRQTFDIQLQKSAWITGTVVRPDGQPAGGAELAILTKDTPGYLHNGKHSRNGSAETITTDAQGRFKLEPREPNSFALMGVHETGVVSINGANLKPDSRLVLEPWGRIEGRSLIGTRPDADREMSYQPRINQIHGFSVHHNYSAKTDAEGRFVFERVVPGPGEVSRTLVTQFVNTWQHTPSWQVPLEMEPGGDVALIVGGKGRPVVGQIRVKLPPEVSVDWTHNEPVVLTRKNVPGKRATADQHFTCAGRVEANGRFQILDVPEGEYDLRLKINGPPGEHNTQFGIGQVSHTFRVPAMTDNRSDDPLDLGVLEGQLADTLEVGERAPNFLLNSVDGQEKFLLGNLRGRLVLLEFWASWSRPSLVQLPTWEAVHQKFGENPRFLMLGMNCDHKQADAARYVDAQKLPWKNAYVGSISGPVGRQYSVRSLPANFLIGPNGRLLGKDLRGKALEEAIEKALADESLFAR